MESMNPTKTKSQETKDYLKPVSLERAKEILSSWEKTSGKFEMAKNMVNDVYKQYPELASKTVPENAYEQYKQDNAKLAEMAGNAANALSPENLAKAFGKNDAEVDDNQEYVVDHKKVETDDGKHIYIPRMVPKNPAPTTNDPDHGELFASFMAREYGDDSLEKNVATKTTTTVPAPQTTPSAPTTTPATPGTTIASPATTPASIPVVSPQPNQMPNQIAQIANPDAAKLAQAKMIADKIKHHPTTMTAEDWEFERNKTNRGMIDEALMAMAGPAAVAPKPENTITVGEPDMNESRRAYAEIMAKYKKEKELDPMVGSVLGNQEGVMAESEHDRYLKLRDQYINKTSAEHERIKNTQGMRAAMEYTKQEWKAFDEALIKDEPSVVRERIGKAMGKIAGVGIAAGILAYVAVEQGIKKLKEVNWREKLKNLGKKKDPLTWKGLIGIKSPEQLKKEEDEAKKVELAKIKDGQKKLNRVFGSPTEIVPSIEVKKTRYMESIMGARLDGEYRSKWNKFKKMPAALFLYPDDVNADWGTNEAGQKIKRTIEDYPDYAQKIHPKLKAYIESKNITREQLATMDVDRLVGRALDEGFITA